VEGLKKALMSGYDNSIHIVEYQDLVNNSKETMEKIYEFLGEEYFEHTFDNVENVNRENDKEIYGFADMHEVRAEVKSIADRPEEILSEEIMEKCKNTEFWRVVENTEEFYDDESEEETELIGG
jgi:sulfotransferase